MKDINLTPKKIVEELDRYIVSQEEAKRDVAVSLRNRYRRKNVLDETMRKEITPKNIILIGTTGVGKTEIARRIANLTASPFIKVEATKYTEVGYVGKDVESIIKDLVEVTIRRIMSEKLEELREIYYEKAIEIVAKKLNNLATINDDSKKNLIENIKSGNYDNEIIEIEKAKYDSNVNGPIVEVIGSGSDKDVGSLLDSIISNIDGKKLKKSKVTVKEAIEIILNREVEKNIDEQEVYIEAIKKSEEDGIIFIDEIDKIAENDEIGKSGVSRQGVQRDILPIVEGTTVMTKYGPVKTEHMLFIAAGAFSDADFSDLMPELQGRFPVVVEMKDLTKEDFIKILTKIDYNLIEQYKALLAVDNVELKLTKTAIEKIAEYSIYLNENEENLGARRLGTIIELILRDVMFEAPYDEKKIVSIDKKKVEKIFKEEFEEENLDKYIL